MTLNNSLATNSVSVWIIYILALTLPFQVYVPLANFPLSTVYILIGACFIFLILSRLIYSNLFIYIPQTIWPISLLLFAIIFYSFSAFDRRASLMSGVQVAAYFVLFFTIVNVLVTEEHIITTIKFLLIGSTINSLLGIAQVLIGTVRPDAVIYFFFDSPITVFILGSRGLERMVNLESLTVMRNTSLDGIGNIFRAFGWFGGPTSYGWFSTTLTIFALGIWITAPKVKSRLIYRAKQAALLGAIAIFFSWTRSAWLTFIIGVVFILIFRYGSSTRLVAKRWWKFGTTLLLALILLVLVGSAFPSSAIGQMILTSVGGADAASSNAGRLKTAEFALEYFLSNPFNGVGFRNYAYISSYGSISLSNTATEATAHNTYLELAVELGLLGVFAFVWLLVHLFVHARKLVKQHPSTRWHALGIAFSAVWVTYALICMFGGNIVEPKWMTYIWMLAGLQFAAIRVLKININLEKLKQSHE